MSYDIYLRAEPCPTCGQSQEPHGPDLPGPTYNLTPIFDLALTGEPLPSPEVTEASVVLFRKETERPRGLRILNGRKAGDTIKMLAAAAHRLTDPDMREQFVALEPENKWGRVEDAVTVIAKLREAAAHNPLHTWEIH